MNICTLLPVRKLVCVISIPQGMSRHIIVSVYRPECLLIIRFFNPLCWCTSGVGFQGFRCDRSYHIIIVILLQHV